MKAVLLLRERHQIADDAFVELRIWRVPRSVRGSEHEYKYALAYVMKGICVLRYDNEAGKGDHKHVGRLRPATASQAIPSCLLTFGAMSTNGGPNDYSDPFRRIP